jgi:hypothetical protein
LGFDQRHAGLVDASCGTRESNALLRLAATRVGHQEGAVVCQEDVLELLLGSLINELLVKSNNALRNSLTNGCMEEGEATNFCQKVPGA